MKKLMSLVFVFAVLSFSSCTQDSASKTNDDQTESVGSDSSVTDDAEEMSEHSSENTAKVQHLTAEELKVGGSQEVKEAHLMEGQVQVDGEELVVTFSMADTKPAMPGCEDSVTEEEQIECFHDALAEHIRKEFRYPEKDLQQRTNLENNRTEGVVEVYFEVNEEGDVERAKVVRSINPRIDAEAIRIIEALPKMKPGIEEGQPVQVRYIVPISFRLL